MAREGGSEQTWDNILLHRIIITRFQSKVPVTNEKTRYF